MGCDIHLHTEVKINGVWHHYGTPSVDRNYQLFAKMAGVRGDERPIAEPRGLPSDATELTKYDCRQWDRDGHTHSYLTAEEIYQLMEWGKAQGFYGKPLPAFWEGNQFGWLFGNDWSGFTKYPDKRRPGLEDVRFVFWFDN
jgi:hypothetical protein